MDLVRVAGLGLRTWGGAPGAEPAVLALHGPTSTSAVRADLAARLDVPVVAPDLPGRGSSAACPAARGLRGLAHEVVRTVDALGLRRVVVVGHSMGAFLAPLVVDALGARAVGTALLDGGVPPRRSPAVRPLVVRALVAVQMRRLLRDRPDADSCTSRAEGRAADGRPDLHAGFRAWSGAVLRPHGEALRPVLDGRRVVDDAVDGLTGEAHLPLLRGGEAPVHLVAAARGADDARPAFLSDAAVEAGRLTVPA